MRHNAVAYVVIAAASAIAITTAVTLAKAVLLI
jgi:hypothetical protein